MSTPNPYAPPRAAVQDYTNPDAVLEQAGRGVRFVANLVDGLIILAFIYAPLVASGAFTSSGAFQTGAAGGMAWGMGVATVAFIVWAWLTIRFVQRNGQSIGKKMFGIKVVRSDGSRASLGRIFWLRNVVNGVLGFIPGYTLVDPLFIFGERRQCLHDKIADTIVVKA